MISLNEYLELNLKKLIQKYHFVICEEKNSYTNAGNAYVIFSNGEIKLKFVSDRNQIFLDFSSLNDHNINNWFSIGLIRNELLNEGDFFDLLTEDNIDFLLKNFESIIEMFSKIRLEATLFNLKQQGRLRAKKLFT